MHQDNLGNRYTSDSTVDQTGCKLDRVKDDGGMVSGETGGEPEGLWCKVGRGSAGNGRCDDIHAASYQGRSTLNRTIGLF